MHVENKKKYPCSRRLRSTVSFESRPRPSLSATTYCVRANSQLKIFLTYTSIVGVGYYSMARYLYRVIIFSHKHEYNVYMLASWKKRYVQRRARVDEFFFKLLTDVDIDLCVNTYRTHIVTVRHANDGAHFSSCANQTVSIKLVDWNLCC